MSPKARRIATLIHEAATKECDGEAWRKRMDSWLDQRDGVYRNGQGTWIIRILYKDLCV